MPVSAKFRTQASKTFLLIYVYIVALPTVLFLYLGFYSLRREWRILLAPRGGNVSSVAREATTNIEAKTVQLAMGFLEDPKVVQARSAAATIASDSELRNVGEQLLDAAKRHRIVRHIFVVRKGVVVIPRLRAVQPAAVAWGAKAAEAFTAGEQLRSAGLYAQAVHAYRRSYDLAVSDAARATSLQRMAEAYGASGQLEAAEQNYRQMGKVYGDICDSSGVPFAFHALMARTTVGEDEWRRADGQMMEGRWNLSASQVEEWHRKFRGRADLGSDESNSYSRRFAMARALQPALAARDKWIPLCGPGPCAANGRQVGGSFALEFGGRQDRYQAFFTKVEKHGPFLVGFITDLDWLEKSVLPQFGIGDQFQLAYRGSSAPAVLRTPFPRLFSFWELLPTTANSRQWLMWTDALTIAGALVMMCSVGVGLVMLYRQVCRERQILRMRQDFVSGVSHELKTPVTIVRLYSETLLEQPDLSSEARECANIITQEAERLTHLLDDVLQFAPVERGEKKYEMKAGDLVAAITPTLTTCRDYLSRKGFSLGLRLPKSAPRVRFDIEAVRSAVLNLVDNAVKYSGNSKLVRVEVSAYDDHIVIAVEDYGIGIAPEELSKIFDAFYRVSIGVSRGGCGLGLFLVKNVMDAHGGKVEVSSTVAGGSCFRLIFPACRGALQEPAAMMAHAES